MSDVESDGPISERRRALFRVVRGEPDDAEVAALTAVLAAAASSAAASSAAASSAAASSAAARGGTGTRPTSGWADRRAMMRRAPHPGPGAWWASALPR